MMSFIYHTRVLLFWIRPQLCKRCYDTERLLFVANLQLQLTDISDKLGLGMTDDASCLVAKAIRDGMSRTH